jgi:hypothetical protein
VEQRMEMADTRLSQVGTKSREMELGRPKVRKEQ